MRGNAARDLILGGIFLAIVASAMTAHGCLIHPGPHFRQTARDVFLEAICPNGRFDGAVYRPSEWGGLLSKEFLAWLGSACLMVWGCYIWRRGTDELAQDEEPGDVAPSRAFGRRRDSSAPAPQPVADIPILSPEPQPQGPLPPSQVLAEFAAPSSRAMDLVGQIAFHDRLRRMIEFEPHTATETMLRAEIEALGCSQLTAAMAIPPEQLMIEGWQYIGDDMIGARHGLERDDAAKPWRAIILSLRYRNTESGIVIVPAFALSAAPAVHDPAKFVNNPSAPREERGTLPSDRRYAADRPTKLRLQGLDTLRPIQDWRADDAHRGIQAHIETAQKLAGAIVLLRFCQVTERYLKSPGLSEPLQPFLTVEREARWDIGITDFCTVDAVRLVWPD